MSGKPPVHLGPGGGERLDLLWSRDSVAAPRHRIEDAYGSALTFPDSRPYLFANFVQTIDGVVIFGDRGGWDAGQISMSSAIDRHIMALLRSQADAIIVGAGTVRSAPHHQWSPGGLVPDAADAFDEFRQATRGRSDRARLYVVTASGRIDPTHVAFTAPEAPATIVTTTDGAARLEGVVPGNVEVVVWPRGESIDPAALVDVVATRSGGLILCEGGPTLLGQLFRAGIVDELFLTVAPQLAGRDKQHRRLGLVESFAAAPDETPKARLHSIRRAHDHLFLRYTTVRRVARP